jgi:hypothetical protein
VVLGKHSDFSEGQTMTTKVDEFQGI